MVSKVEVFFSLGGHVSDVDFETTNMRYYMSSINAGYYLL